MPIQTFKAKLKHKDMITPDVMLLEFKLDSKLEFKAGQFVNIKVAENTRRSYSILDTPENEMLQIAAKIIDDGTASERFKEAKIDEEFEVKGPFGHFVLDEETDDEHVFIATGTGVVPFYNMLKHYATHDKKRKFALIFGARTEQNLLFNEEFLKMDRDNPNFSYQPTLTRQDWEGKKGRVQNHIEKNTDNKTFYICGLKEQVLETKELLLSLGVKNEKIKTERYT